MPTTKVFPLKIEDSSDELNEGLKPTPSVMMVGEEEEEDTGRVRYASNFMHKGPLPEILQDIYECPPGLEPLADTDYITIESQFEPEDVLMGYDSDYRFQILNNEEDRIFFAGKVSHWKTMHLCWRCNSYEIHAMNFEGTGVFSISCQASCCKDVIKVYLDDGLLGILTCGCKVFPSIKIKDDDGVDILQALMTSCPCCNCYSGAATFEIKVCGTKNNIGKIEKLSKPTRNNAERYSISFRKDINVRVKVMLVAALFHVGARFLNTRYATLERRIHADHVDDTEQGDDVLNAIADEDSSYGSGSGGSKMSVHSNGSRERKSFRRDSDKKKHHRRESDKDKHHRRESDKDKQHRRESEMEKRPRKESDKEDRPRKESEKEGTRKDSEQERARKLAENLNVKRQLGIQRARKLSEEEKAKLRKLENEKAENETLSDADSNATKAVINVEKSKLRIPTEIKKSNEPVNESHEIHKDKHKKVDRRETELHLDLPEISHHTIHKTLSHKAKKLKHLPIRRSTENHSSTEFKHT